MFLRVFLGQSLTILMMGYRHIRQAAMPCQGLHEGFDDDRVNGLRPVVMSSTALMKCMTEISMLKRPLFQGQGAGEAIISRFSEGLSNKLPANLPMTASEPGS